MFRCRRLTAVMRLCLATTLIVTCAPGWALGEPAPRRFSSGRTLPLTNFYDTKPLPAGRPGQLIRSEATYDYLLSPEIRTVRILYHSRSANGDDVAVSGVVLLPDRAAPAAGWPVIAWAHSFVGVARTCAPSLMANLYAGSYLSMYVMLGYAVVATDYAGLGTTFRNAYLDGESNAADVIYSVPAARAAVSQLGRNWVLLGNSEGGLAVLAAAEMEHDLRDRGYRGGIAIAAPLKLQNMYEDSSPDPVKVALLAYGTKTVFPEFRVSDLFTEKGITLYHGVEKSCAVEAGGSAAELLKPNWKDNRFVHQFLTRNRPAQKTAFGPLLLISSELDPETPITAAANAVSAMCKLGDGVQLYRDQAPNPNAVFGDTVQYQIAWIRARFAGGSAPTDCH